MSQACAGWRGEIGAYVVGALGPVEAAGVRRHLRGCAACRADYQDLVPVPHWLSRMNPADGMPPRQPPGRPPLKPLRPPRQRVRRRWLAAAGTVIAAAAIAVATVLPAHPAQPGVRAFDPGTGVYGLATLRGTPTGTRIDLALSGLPAGQRCTLITVSRAGTAVAGTWTAEHDGTAEITGATAIPLRQLTALRVETPADRLLLSIPLLSGRCRGATGWRCPAR
jgi:anti-sigma factor RsiW